MRKGLVLGMFVLVTFAGGVRSSEAGCFTDLALCMARAGAEDNIIWRTLMALDCELDFIECGRIKIIGT